MIHSRFAIAFWHTLRPLPLRRLPIQSLPAADLKLCNSTSSRIGVSIGYQDPEGWATEGWWTIASQTCETLLKGPFPAASSMSTPSTMIAAANGPEPT